MLSSTGEPTSYNWRVDVNGVDETLAVIFSEAELNFSMQVLYGIIKQTGIKAIDITSSFKKLKDKFIKLNVHQQMEYDGELLKVFFWSWNQIDAQEKFDYLADQITKPEFPCERFVEKFVQYRRDATDISSFLDIFRDITPLIEEKVKTMGIDVSPESSLGLLIANYKYDLID